MSTSGSTSGGLTLDTGALIAIERNSRPIRLLINEALAAGDPVDVVAGVLAQAWRGGSRHARLARLLNADGVRVQPLDDETARAVGELCGRTGHDDVVDVHVVLHARQHGHRVATSDPDDLLAVDPHLQVIAI